MKTMLIVQPHRDDAVFSIAEHMLTWAEDGILIDVLTVFGTLPEEPIHERDKHKVMAFEWSLAMKHLQPETVRDFYSCSQPDAATREITNPDPSYLDLMELRSDVRRQVVGHIETLQPDVVVGPTGIHHVDHYITKFATVDHRAGNDRWYYDELPYFATYPAEAYDSQCIDGDNDYVLEGCREHRIEKQQIVSYFRSQVGDTEERTLLVPERVWRPA